MARQKRVSRIARRGEKRPGRAATFRFPPDLVEGLDAMAAEVGLNRQQLVTFLLQQAVTFHRAEASQPGLFAPAEAIIDAHFRKLLGARRDG